MSERFDLPRKFGDHYTLISELGSGGTSEVFEALDTAENGPGLVALKVLSIEAAQDPDLRERFRRERQVAAKIHHPHVLAVYESGEIEGRLYIAMQLVNGTDLGTLLELGPLRSAEAAVSIVEQIGSALDKVHTKMGLSHRDVKPSNILLEPSARSGGYHASLIDWGIAQLAATNGTSPVTHSGQFVGTVPYIAPERLRKEMTSDHRADVYSLAVVLYECLAGRPPFVGVESEVLTAHLDRDPPPLPGRLPSALRDVVATGLEKNPGDRYQSAGELVDAARRALDQQRVPWSNRWRVLSVVGGAVGALVALVLFLVGSVYWPTQSWVLPALTVAGACGIFALSGSSGRTGTAPRNPRPSDPTFGAEPGGFPQSRS